MSVTAVNIPKSNYGYTALGNNFDKKDAAKKELKSDCPIFEEASNICAVKIEEPSVIKAPLVGLYIIDFESSATNLTKEQIYIVKIFYNKFIKKAVNKLVENGHKKPLNEEELSTLCKDITSIIWDKDNFTYKETNLLIEGLATETKTLDFVIGSYVIADVLNQFGVSSKLVSLPDYLNLHCSINGISTYFNAASTYATKAVMSEKEVKEKYTVIYGEFDFKLPNPILYNNRGIAKSTSKNYSGAIADFTQAIKLFPKGPKAYYNRGLAKLWSGNCDGAISDFTKTIPLDSNFADADYAGACIEYGRGNYEKVIKYYNNFFNLNFDNNEQRFIFQLMAHFSYIKLGKEEIANADGMIFNPNITAEWLYEKLDEAGMICHQK